MIVRQKKNNPRTETMEHRTKRTQSLLKPLPPHYPYGNKGVPVKPHRKPKLETPLDAINVSSSSSDSDSAQQEEELQEEELQEELQKCIAENLEPLIAGFQEQEQPMGIYIHQQLNKHWQKRFTQDKVREAYINVWKEHSQSREQISTPEYTDFRTLHGNEEIRQAAIERLKEVRPQDSVAFIIEASRKNQKDVDTLLMHLRMLLSSILPPHPKKRVYPVFTNNGSPPPNRHPKRRQLQARRQEPLLAEDEEAQGNWKVLMGASPKSIPTRELLPGRPDLADKKHTWWLLADPRLASHRHNWYNLEMAEVVETLTDVLQTNTMNLGTWMTPLLHSTLIKALNKIGARGPQNSKPPPPPYPDALRLFSAAVLGVAQEMVNSDREAQGVTEMLKELTETPIKTIERHLRSNGTIGPKACMDNNNSTAISKSLRYTERQWVNKGEEMGWYRRIEQMIRDKYTRLPNMT